MPLPVIPCLRYGTREYFFRLDLLVVREHLDRRPGAPEWAQQVAGRVSKALFTFGPLYSRSRKASVG